MISSSQRPLPDNTQHSQQTDIHAPDGIRTHNPSRRAATDPRLRPRSHFLRYIHVINIVLVSCLKITPCAHSIWSRVFLQKPIGLSAGQQIFYFYGSHRFIDEYTEACSWATTWVACSQPTSLCPSSLKIQLSIFSRIFSMFVCCVN